ncbi:hypothetical protein K470DRAFT_258371 [Piedraia hortae CBS 480.64]|uniref:Glc8 protein n=1 Tax=Piedraia hortae CBS 480.64 TaxID=1314780 RepID=A0A6A7BZ92_9PEZI|nr:hypothetical protein K470DRAFT_258371 [Piedraia hortae CBS 480.64]
MASTEHGLHSPPSEIPKRPKGILKNSKSYQQLNQSESAAVPANEAQTVSSDEPLPAAVPGSDRPPIQRRNLSEREITQMNTELNAGAGGNRSSSRHRAQLQRRPSGQSNSAENAQDHAMKLKWDEANLWLNEGQMGGKMKIDEPKTPYAKQYDPAEDEEELSTINPQQIAVDELEMEKSKVSGSKKKVKEDDIPDIDLGEPEVRPKTQDRRTSDGDRRVTVNKQPENDNLHHGEDESGMSREELEKHKKFEEMRKKHYEMKNVKNLLGHPEKLDELADDETMDD